MVVKPHHPLRKGKGGGVFESLCALVACRRQIPVIVHAGPSVTQRDLFMLQLALTPSSLQASIRDLSSLRSCCQTVVGG